MLVEFWTSASVFCWLGFAFVSISPAFPVASDRQRTDTSSRIPRMGRLFKFVGASSGSEMRGGLLVEGYGVGFMAKQVWKV